LPFRTGGADRGCRRDCRLLALDVAAAVATSSCRGDACEGADGAALLIGIPALVLAATYGVSAIHGAFNQCPSDRDIADAAAQGPRPRRWCEHSVRRPTRFGSWFEGECVGGAPRRSGSEGEPRARGAARPRSTSREHDHTRTYAHRTHAYAELTSTSNDPRRRTPDVHHVLRSTS
jgi:hypothetical protein